MSDSSATFLWHSSDWSIASLTEVISHHKTCCFGDLRRWIPILHFSRSFMTSLFSLLLHLSTLIWPGFCQPVVLLFLQIVLIFFYDVVKPFFQTWIQLPCVAEETVRHLCSSFIYIVYSIKPHLQLETNHVGFFLSIDISLTAQWDFFISFFIPHTHWIFVLWREHVGQVKSWRLHTAHQTNGPVLGTCSC